MNNELLTLLQEIDGLKSRLDAVRPLVHASILEAVETEYTYDSNRIEGNTLTLRETDIIIHKGLTVGGKSMREHLEAANHYEAIQYIKDLVQQKEDITEGLIKNIHAIILRGIDRRNAGAYRSLPVAISGSRHIPPQPMLIPDLMGELSRWLKKEAPALHPVIFAAELHERIATIHPFIDGNGRTARLLMNLVLLQAGYTIVNIPGDSESRVAYYNALEKCNTGNDKHDFYMLIAGYVKSSLQNMISITGK